MGIWGEAELCLGIWGAKAKYFEGAEEIIFRDLERSMHYFHGSRDYRPPWGLHIGPAQGHKTMPPVSLELAIHKLQE